MPLFGKKPPKSAPVQAPVATNIARGLVVTGDISGDGELRLDGSLRGNIACKRLVVGSEGELHGEVTVDALIVEGSIVGTIKAKTVLLGATARVIGDVDHEVLEVHPGAEIEGRYSQSGFDAAGKKGLARAKKTLGAMQKEAPPTGPSKTTGIEAEPKMEASSASSQEAGSTKAAARDGSVTH